MRRSSSLRSCAIAHCNKPCVRHGYCGAHYCIVVEGKSEEEVSRNTNAPVIGITEEEGDEQTPQTNRHLGVGGGGAGGSISSISNRLSTSSIGSRVSDISQFSQLSSTGVLIQGYLQKLSSSALVGFQKRWVVVKINAGSLGLFYYKKEGDVVSRGSQQVKESTLLQLVSRNAYGKAYAFSLVFDSKSLVLVAPAEQEYLEWLNALQKVTTPSHQVHDLVESARRRGTVLDPTPDDRNLEEIVTPRGELNEENITCETAIVPPPVLPLFAKAEKETYSFFSNLVEDPDKGTVTVCDERYLYLRADSLAYEFFQVMGRLFGFEDEKDSHDFARNLLFDLAHAVGKNDAKNFHSRMRLVDPLTKLTAGPIHFAFTGWAKVDTTPSFPDDDHKSMYDHPFSFEAASWMSKGEKSAFPVCVMSAGYSSGWCELCYDCQLSSVEVSCRACGDDKCRFIMGQPHLLRGYVEEYLKGDEAKLDALRIPDVPLPAHLEKDMEASPANWPKKEGSKAKSWLANATKRLVGGKQAQRQPPDRRPSLWRPELLDEEDDIDILDPNAISKFLEQAGKKVKHFFDSKEREPIEGRIEIRHSRFILVRAKALSTEFFELSEAMFGSAAENRKVGREFARNFLFDMAHAIGYNDSMSFSDKLQLKGSLGMASAFKSTMAYSGWGNVTCTEQTKFVCDASFLLVVDVQDSFEAVSWQDKETKDCMCHMLTGYIAGWMFASFQVPMSAVEARCKCRGDDKCTVIVSMQETLEKRLGEFLASQGLEDRAGTLTIPKRGDFREKCSIDTNWMYTLFENVLTNPVTCQAFEQHLEKEYAQENIFFYKAVKKFKQMPPGDPDIQTVAMDIYNTYVKDDSQWMLNLNDSTKRELDSIFEGGEKVDLNVFNKAYTAVKLLMETDSFRRYMATVRKSDAAE